MLIKYVKVNVCTIHVPILTSTTLSSGNGMQWIAVFIWLLRDQTLGLQRFCVGVWLGPQAFLIPR